MSNNVCKGMQQLSLHSTHSNVSSTRANSIEQILEDLDGFGRFQKLALFYYMFLEVGSAFICFIPVFDVHKNTFIGNTATSEWEYRTVGWTNETNIWNILGKMIGANSESFSFESPADEWNLSFERAWIVDIVTSCFMVGMLIGSLLWSQLADYYGRRPVYLSIVANMLAGTLLCIVSPTVEFFVVARFIAGISVGGFINISYMSVMEFMTPAYRSYAISAGCLGEGTIILSVLGYFIRPWRCLYLATLVPYALILPLYFLLPETPRWLLKNQKKQEFKKLLDEMAKVNGRPPVSPEVFASLFKPDNQTSRKKQTMGYMEFFGNKDLRKSTLLLSVVWFTANLSWFGITYNIRNVPGNIYVNLGLMGVANAVGQKLTTPFSDRLGRRLATLYGMALGALFLVSLSVYYLFMDNISPVMILLGCVGGLFGVSMGRASLKLLNGELFPTEVRGMGVGISVIGAHLAGILSPQLVYIGGMHPSVTYLTFAVVSVIGPLIGFLLKETNGNPLRDEEQPRT